MAKAGKRIYYWDTNTFIAWLDGGKGHPVEVISGLDEIANEINEGRSVLCTSVITNTEVLEGKLTPDQAVRLQNLFKRRNVIQVSVDTRISQRASAIRNYYSQRGIKFGTPDCIHLATAIIYGVDEFHTLDGDGKRQRSNDLLRLNGDVAGYPLHIRVPTAVQPSLLAGIAPLPLVSEGNNAEQERQDPVKPLPADVPGGGGRPAEGKAGAEIEIPEAGAAIKPEQKRKKREDGSINVH
jgi:predicted nucleic acid-binding protein